MAQKNVNPAVAIVVILIAIGVIGLIGWYVFVNPPKQTGIVRVAPAHEHRLLMKNFKGGVGLKGMKGIAAQK
jgi:hypothetical protein